MSDESSSRLNKYIAFHYGSSRREADQLIGRGRVTINGKSAELGGRVNDGDVVAIDGKPITPKQSYSYLAFHKPVGYVCSRRAQGDSPTIYSLLPKKLHQLKPVGRLDKDSSGLLILSDDGDFAYHMTHPKFHKTKTYLVSINRPLEPLHQQMISDFGVVLEDGRSLLVLEKKNEARTDWQISMHEGRNRQIRRTFAALGYDVTSLHRTQFGQYEIAPLVAGEYNTVSP